MNSIKIDTKIGGEKIGTEEISGEMAQLEKFLDDAPAVASAKKKLESADVSKLGEVLRCFPVQLHSILLILSSKNSLGAHLNFWDVNQSDLERILNKLKQTVPEIIEHEAVVDHWQSIFATLLLKEVEGFGEGNQDNDSIAGISYALSYVPAFGASKLAPKLSLTFWNESHEQILVTDATLPETLRLSVAFLEVVSETLDSVAELSKFTFESSTLLELPVLATSIDQAGIILKELESKARQL